MNVMNFINKVNSKTKQFEKWWGNLSYEKKFFIILLSVFVGIPVSFWTTLILPMMAFVFFVLAAKMFQYGKKEDDMFFLFPTTLLGAITIGLSYAWFSLLIR